MTVATIETLSRLAGSGTYALTIQVLINGEQKASWSLTPTPTYTDYIRSQNVSFALTTGDTITYKISGGTLGTAGGRITGPNYVKLCSQTCEKPTITTFTGTPGSIQPGDNATLTWLITGANTASINQGIGAVNPTSGTITVSPTSSTTYTLTASNSCGSNTATATIQILGECPGAIKTYFQPQNAYGQDITVSGNYLYFAVDHDHWFEEGVLHLKPGLQVWNITNPESPSYVTTISAGNAGQDANGWVVEVSGFFAYVGFGRGGTPDAPGGILFVNITNPASPVYVAVYNTPANEGVRALSIQGNYVYAIFSDAQTGTQLHVLNITDPTQVSDVGQIAVPVVEPKGMAVSGNYVYLATGPWGESNGNGGLWVVNVSNPSQPTVVTKHPLPFPGDGSSIWAPALEVGGNFVYLAYSGSGIVFGSDDHWDHAGLQIVNISNPLSPVNGGAVEIGQDVFPSDIALGDEFAYLAAGRNDGGGTPERLGLIAINIHDPASPVLSGYTSVNDPNSPGVGIWRSPVITNYAFGVTGGPSGSGTSVIDISGCIETAPSNNYLV